MDLGGKNIGVMERQAITGEVPSGLPELFRQGLQACDTHEYTRALQLFRLALSIDPHAVDVHFNIAKVLKELGQIEEAVQAYHKVLVLNPADAAAMYNLGNILHQAGRLDQAAIWYAHAIATEPRSANSWINLGALLEQQGDVTSAVGLLRHAVELDPHSVEGHNNLASALLKLGELDEAEAACRIAVSLDPHSAEAYNNLGGIQKSLGNYVAAEDAYRAALSVRAEFPETMKNLASALHAQGRFQEEIDVLRLCLETRPEYADAHMDLALALLLTGELDEGWREYEWRFRVSEPDTHLPPMEEPLWDGSSIEGKSVLLRAEQGIGDTIQFIRYVPVLARLGARVLVEAPANLQRILSRVDGLHQVIRRGEPLPEFDFQCPMLSVPLKLGPARARIPVSAPYLRPDPEKVGRFRRMIGSTPGLVHVGIAWAGNRKHRNDAERSVDAGRFCALRMPGVKFHSLQIDGASETSTSAQEELDLVEHASHVEDFDDTAALIESLDLVITVDTAIAHLAGALGKPVWTLIPFLPDWRWQIGRDDSPWYPTMRLFRQHGRGEWNAVFQDIREALQEFSVNFQTSGDQGSDTRASEGGPDWAAFGSLCLKKGDYAGAVEYLHLALSVQHNDARLWNDIGIAHQSLGNFREAVEAYHESLCQDSGLMHTYFNLGVCYGQMLQHQEAIDAYSRGLSIDPDSVELRFNRAVMFERLGDHESAYKDFEVVVRRGDTIPGAHAGMARALSGLQMWHEAATAYDAAISQEPRSARLRLEFAGVLTECGRRDQAEVEVGKALQLQPDLPEAHNNAGALLRSKGDLSGAEKAFRQALHFRADFYEAHLNLGELLTLREVYDEAYVHLLSACDLRPDDAEPYAHLGDLQIAQGDAEAARKSYEVGLYHKPAHVGLCVRMGSLSRTLDAMEDARCWYEQALLLAPDNPDAHWHYAQLLLLLGEYEEGWKEYEWRWKHPRFATTKVNFPQPEWDGDQDLRGATILLHAEQGFGDILQCIRYVPRVADRGAKVLLGVPEELKRLARRIRGVSSVHSTNATLPPFEVHAPLMSLPRLFRSTINSVPADVPYLSVDAHTSSSWQERIRNDASAFRIGLVWSGNPQHMDNRRRVCALSEFSPLAGIPGIVFFRLHKGETGGGAQDLPEGMVLRDYTEDLHDFMDTAGLIQNLDLIISIDTAVAHLAGALGKPVWTLLPYSAEWRWLHGRTDTPWYPTMRLYRQIRSGDWTSAVRQMRNNLERLVAQISHREERN